MTKHDLVHELVRLYKVDVLRDELIIKATKMPYWTLVTKINYLQNRCRHWPLDIDKDAGGVCYDGSEVSGKPCTVKKECICQMWK